MKRWKVVATVEVEILQFINEETQELAQEKMQHDIVTGSFDLCDIEANQYAPISFETVEVPSRWNPEGFTL